MGVKKKVKTVVKLSAQVAVAVLLCACSGEEDPAAERETQVAPGDSYCGRPVEDFAMVIDLILERADNFPKPGEKAVSFSLPNARTGDYVGLSDLHKEKPLVLIFGSGSCSTLGKSEAWMLDFHRRFGEHFQFAFIYIRESHPEQGYRPDKYTSATPPVFDAETLEGRIREARSYATRRDLPFPVLADEISDETARQYSAWPVRLFVIDRNGTVLYVGGQGPWFYRPYRGFRHKPPVDPKLQILPNSPISLEEYLEDYLRRS